MVMELLQQIEGITLDIIHRTHQQLQSASSKTKRTTMRNLLKPIIGVHMGQATSQRIKVSALPEKLLIFANRKKEQSLLDGEEDLGLAMFDEA